MKLKSSCSKPMNKGLEKIALSSLVAVLGVMGLGVWMPTPTMGQNISQVSSQDQAALAEAERLSQQIGELYRQEKYNEAIPLAEKALAIR